ncbi:putative secreted effector protein, partial [Blumeria graminis f. sp. tritici 96224]
MSCVFAFLLSTVGRFVLVGMGPSNDHYSVHKAPGLKTFPLLEREHHIFTSVPKYQHHGTYHTIYCSFRLTQSEIVRKFDDYISHHEARLTENDLSDANQESDDYLKTLFSIEEDQNAERRCLKFMEKINRISEKNYMSNSRLKFSCSMNAIAGLAFKGKVGIDGDYRCFAPVVNGHEYLITADKPIHMSDLLPKRALLHHQKSPSLTNALVWYQGNLLVFKKKTVQRESKWAFQAVPYMRNIKTQRVY